MRINSSIFFWILFVLVACQPKGKSEVAAILGIDEPEEWILVIHPEGCKTCLDSFYAELEELPQETPGALVILAKNSKSLLLNPLFENSPVPLHLDEEKKLIQEGLLEITDQILLFRSGSVEYFDILDYQRVIETINKPSRF